jgi:malate dehydrogenase
LLPNHLSTYCDLTRTIFAVSAQAYAGQVFTSRLLAAISGEPNVVECTFVENTLTPAPFFSTPVSAGPGVL